MIRRCAQPPCVAASCSPSIAQHPGGATDPQATRVEPDAGDAEIDRELPEAPVEAEPEQKNPHAPSNDQETTCRKAHCYPEAAKNCFDTCC